MKSETNSQQLPKVLNLEHFSNFDLEVGLID